MQTKMALSLDVELSQPLEFHFEQDERQLSHRLALSRYFLCSNAVAEKGSVRNGRKARQWRADVERKIYLGQYRVASTRDVVP